MKKPMEQEKIFVNDAMNKGLISKILKQPIQLDNIKNKQHTTNPQQALSSMAKN